MKKAEVMRNYNFDDANLVQLCRTTIAYMRRDAVDFTTNGTLPAQVAELEVQTEAFENFVTDAEALGNQEEATVQKDKKAEELRVLIRAVMTKAENRFGLQSARYKKYGTEALSRFDDANLIICARRVARVATTDLPLLSPSPYGLTATHITDVRNKANEVETALITQKERIGDRDILQEDRVEMGNKLYDSLVAYCNTGKNIWETRDVAKYNDYVIYNTPTALPPDTTVADQ